MGGIGQGNINKHLCCFHFSWLKILRCLSSPPLQAATKLLEQYKTAAIEHLDSLTSSDLKSLLRRMVGKIFCDFEIMSCCDDDPSRNADSRETLGESAG